MQNYVKGKCGLEIGGPTIFFGSRGLSLYQNAKEIDGVNFSNNTIWEGSISSGQTYAYAEGHKGHQYISDATELSEIKSGHYEFILSSDCLEHIANPIKALLEWKRVLKTGCPLLLSLPNKIFNFDRNRPDTTFEHILEDYTKNTEEDDITHLRDFINLFYFTAPPDPEEYANFIRSSLNNLTIRGVHHHVFNMDVIQNMLSYTGFSVTALSDTFPGRFLAVAIKLA